MDKAWPNDKFAFDRRFVESYGTHEDGSETSVRGAIRVESRGGR